MNQYKIDVCELDEESETVEQPDNINIQLKPHQLTLLYKCIDFENNRIKLKSYKSIRDKYTTIQENDYIKTHVGILGDKVGSGKSYVILALIMKNKDINYSQIETFGHNKVFLNISTQVENYKTNLLVVPHNLFYQWGAYIKNMIDDDKLTYKLIGQKKNLQEFTNDAKKLNKYDLILVTDTNFKQITNIINLNNIKINRVIFDEIDSLKIPNNKNIACKFYWFLTASYGNLLYPKGYRYYDSRVNVVVNKATGLSNKGYIKDLFTSIMKDRYKDFSNLLVIKNKDSFVDKSFNIPEPNQYIIECKDPIETKLLNGIVDKNIINCLNADNDKGAISLFDSKQKKTEDNIINIVIEKYLSDISNINIQIEAINQIIYSNDEESNIEQRNQRVSRLNTKKNKIESKITDIKDRIKNSKVCSICFDDDIADKSIVKCCSNIFCFKCINLWLCQKASCPLCKNNLKEDELYLIQDKEDEIDNEILDTDEINKNFDKLQNLEILLKNKKKDSKYLIFSEYDISFENIIKIFNDKYKYSYLKGNKYIIQRILRDYKIGDLDILLVNIHNYGSGLNLENTTDIIMFHKFDANIENQVIGRAQRFGRTEPLNIHYLLNQNEISQI